MRLRPAPRRARCRGADVGGGVPEAARRGGRLMAFIPHTEADVAAMLAAIGAARIEDLFDEIPPQLRIRSLAGVPEALNEMEVGRLMSERAARRRHRAQLPRRRSLRAPHPGGRVGHHHPRGVLQRLHALPGGGQPGHAAAHLRVPDHDRAPHRHGCRQCLDVRRRVRDGGGRAHGGARQPQVEVGAHPRARERCTRTTARVAHATACNQGLQFRGAAVLRRRRARPCRGARALRQAGHHRPRHPAAELLRPCSRTSMRSPTGRTRAASW